MPPTYGDGRTCYVEKYQHWTSYVLLNSTECAFVWTIRQWAVGRAAFDDAVGVVSGSWGLGSKEASEPGLLFCIMVNSAAATIERLVANGGETVKPMGADAPEITEISEPRRQAP